MVHIPLEDKDHNILVIDPSSSHLAYTFSNYDSSTKEFTIISSGMLWAKDSWSRGNRFLYMLQSIELLINSIHRPTVVVSEQFFLNPKMFSGGSAVVPTINAFLELNCAKYNIEYNELPPPRWRATLNIKAIKDSKGKRDYKTPTIQYVESIIGKLPEQIQSNITLKQRDTPHDLADSLAITLALSKELGVKKVSLANAAFLPFTLIGEFNKLSKNI